MKYTILITSILILFLSGTQYAGGSEFAWANQVSGSIDDAGDGIAMDYAGNVFITGTFDGTLSVGSETLECTGVRDTYLIKYDSKGNFLWARSSDSDYTNYGYAVSADASGNCILTGKFYDSITFDGWTLSSSGDGDIYIVKFDPNGNVIWAKGAGGTNNDCGRTIATNDTGDTFISGYVSGVAYFDSISLPPPTSSFLAKYDSDGNAVWAKKTGSFQVGVSHVYVTADESGNCYLARNIPLGQDQDIHISKYDTTGSVVWTKVISSESRHISDYPPDFPRGIAVDNWGNVFIAGVFDVILAFSSDILVCNSSPNDIFIAKYDPNGSELWARQVCGAYYGGPQALSIVTDNQGDVIATGYFRDTVRFDDVTLTSNGSNDLFICKYDGNGNLIWALANGGTSGDRGSCVAANECGDIATTGSFRDTVTFGPTTLTCETGYDVFVTKVDKTLTGDFDRNCRVDIQDLVDLSYAWLSRLGEPEWIPACEISEFEDGIINLLDFTVFAEQFGGRY